MADYKELYPGVLVFRDGRVFKEANSSLRGGKTVKYRSISINGIKFDIHRLVAISFLPNPENKPCVCHVDDNPLNNDVNNLFWGTHNDNMQDAVKKNRFPKGRKNDSRDQDIFLAYKKGGSIEQISHDFNLKPPRIYQIIQRLKEHTKVDSGSFRNGVIV